MTNTHEPILYIRGIPPGPPPPLSPELVRAAKILVNLDDTRAQAIADSLRAYDGFLDQATLQQQLLPNVDSEEIANDLARFIWAVNARLRLFRQTVDDFVSDIERWLDSEPNRGEQVLTRDQFEVLSLRLQVVLQRLPGIEKQVKAEYLAQATGNPIEQIALICDLRPVFDHERETVEGMFPITTLKIVCTGVDGLPISLEAILDEDDVTRLAKASSDAQKKLKALHALIDATTIHRPSTSPVR